MSKAWANFEEKSSATLRQESRQETNHGSRRDSGHDIRLNSRRDSGHDNRRDGGDSVAETHREIEQESERIRKEMERERRAKSFSPARDRSPTRTYLTVTASPKTSIHREIKPDAGGRQSLSDEEKERSAELKATQSALEITENALFEARGNLKAVQAQYEDARTQLMLSEYRKENTSKELVRMSDDLRRKQKESKNLDTATRNKQEELKQFDDIGFTKEEAIQIIESNEAMKSRLRNLDAIHAERDELIQQLEGTKQELFHEQKKARTKIEELKEEVENVTSTCEQMQTEKDEFDKKMQKLESAYKQMEKEKNELIQEKTRQYEEERDNLKSERSELRKRNHDEVESIRKDLIKMTNQVAALQDEVRSKDEINLQLRDQILEHQQKSEQAMTSRSSIVEEHKRTLQTLRKETDTAMVQMRESLFLEKQKTVDTLRDELEQERRDIAARAEERYEGQIADQAAIIKAKNNELSHLVKLVDKLEKEKTRIKVKVDDEVKMEVQEAVSKERKVMEQEQDWAVRKEREGLQAEHRYTLKKLQDELAIEKQQKLTLEKQLKDLKNELEDVRNANKSAVHEKLVAVARAKELMRQEHQADVDRIKEQLKNEYKKETDRLRETVRIQEEELRQFREERLRYVKQQKEANQSMDRTERTLINEINEECRKTSEVLGLTPRKVNINSYRDNGYVSSPAMTNNSSTKVPTTAALFKIMTSPRIKSQQETEPRGSRANLRACNEELRMHVTDLQHEMEVQRNSVNLAAREKDEALTNLKRQLEREKEEEISRLKEKLVKGLSTNEYRSLLYTPDNEAAFRQTYQVKSHPMERQMRQMSDSQQRDLDRLEREISKLAMNQSPMMDGAETQEDINYAKNLAHLQDKVKQLQAENNGLRRAKLNTVSSSTPDLSSPNMYSTQNYRKFMPRPTSPSRDQQRIASALELRMKEHDYETEVLTEHQKRSRDTMSRKMAEMSKLQNTLTNQAKELIQLEKSYTQLNQHAKSPRPRSSLR